MLGRNNSNFISIDSARKTANSLFEEIRIKFIARCKNNQKYIKLDENENEYLIPSSYDISGRLKDRICKDVVKFLIKGGVNLSFFNSKKKHIANTIVDQLYKVPLKRLNSSDACSDVVRRIMPPLLDRALSSKIVVAVPDYVNHKQDVKYSIALALKKEIVNPPPIYPSPPEYDQNETPPSYSQAVSHTQRTKKRPGILTVL